ncbi:Scd6-like Sm domain-containing protein [Hypoxylon trugodes]|uniref:Scd6-like Sm domain-containing protein n=1 Tax=Hypoxylon trugodes TaxID=326681 RepID=UPI00219E95C5|nr:Scd6-like Sm domain-containing protein [Hypoxylon trugodes]KAI1388211.1 Scd6-like Sm domain-containing protein [Hypoxylon trugodes]
MSEFLGSRISLISKSDIRYSGVLHEINSEESTVSLENVRSFGTEGRKGNPDEEIAPSDQVYEYIVFRGSDVKDLRIEQAPVPPKENQPPKVPDDPAIVGARTRPAPLAGAIPPGPGAPGYGQSPYQPNPFYPPPPGQWGRGGPGPGPAQGFHGMPYPPPPGWFPPGQGFPAGGPGGPGPWNSFGYPPGPGPQGQHLGAPGAPPQVSRGTPQQDSKPAPIGAGVDKQKLVGNPPVELPSTEPKSVGQQPPQPAPTSAAAPTPPVESKPTVAEVKATAESLSNANAAANNVADKKAIPTGPKSNRVTPAVPIPNAIISRSGPQVTAAAASIKPVGDHANGQSGILGKDATQAAKAAVAAAMAKLEDNPRVAEASTQPIGNMDNLTKKVNEMRMTAPRNGTNGRGRGRGGRPGGQPKVNVPDSDFDFAAGNAKFNKQDLVKEAIAGSPQVEPVAEPAQVDDTAALPVAYNKTRSFFDNISSEAKDRAENGGQKPGGREWRGEEQRKNMETFGQGSVDGGYRGGYRGRGRGGRGNRGRGYGGRGRGTGYRQAAAQ